MRRPRTSSKHAGGRDAAARERSALEDLARLAGIEGAYTDGFGRERRVEPEPLLALLRALDVGIDSAADAPRALAALVRERGLRRVEPAHVIEDGESASVRLRIPEKRRKKAIEAVLTLEDGSTERLHLDPARSHPVAALVLDRERVLELEIGLGRAELPPGIHELTLDLRGSSARTFLIRAPTRAHELSSRIWGPFLPLYAIRTRRDRGCGDLADLRRLVELSSSFGASTVGTLPLLAAYLEGGPDGPFDPSPYSPASRLLWNELYVAPELAPEFDSEPVRRVAESTELRASVAAARREELVDHRAVMRALRRVLEAMRKELPRRPERAAAFRAWLAGHPRVTDYSEFRAAVERHGAWPRWSPRARDGELDASDFDPDVAGHHAYAQWLAHEQLEALDADARARGSGLYLDLPVGVHGASYDTWRERGSFLLGVSAGAPPDAIFERGQDWGFPPLHPRRGRELGHRHHRDVLRHHLRFANLLRVDHVMGWHRMYCIPAGGDATQGAYVRFPARELYGIACLESVRARAVLVGEDLGTVPEEVRPEMERRGILRMQVAQFDVRAEPDEALPDPPRGALAALNTHDLPPFAAFWRGLDIDDRLGRGLTTEAAAVREREDRALLREAIVHDLRSTGLLPAVAGPRRRSLEVDGRAESDLVGERDVLVALLEHLSASEADVLIVDLADLALETEPHNRPGVLHETNWRLRARGLLSDLDLFFRREDVRDALERTAAQRSGPS